MSNMAPVLRPLLLAGLLSTLTMAQFSNPSPLASYSHDIFYDDGAVFRSRIGQIPEFLPTTHAPSDVSFRQAAGNSVDIPARFAAGLFTPNTEQQPAETPGQVQNYMRALQEEAREAERAENRLFEGESGGGARSYVDVKVGGGGGARNYNYRYTV